ncbi:MAG TPA: rhamnulokinase family protein [bacterium]|nr:rhamnulokinase family protein [bacterium]
MGTSSYLAYDLGAESGRAVLGRLSQDNMTLEEIHRFPNGPVRVMGSMYWDVLRLFSEMKLALRKCMDTPLDGIGVDTWGVDFGLLGRDDVLLGNPYHYRDARTDGMFEEAFRVVPRQTIFEHTGIQFMQLNTLYQLLAMVRSNSVFLERAETLLLMADLFHFWFCGRKTAEFTLATTSQAYDPRKEAWSKFLLDSLQIPSHIFPEIVPPGTVLGDLLPSLQSELGVGAIPVIAPASHDTGCAVAAVPAEGERWAYLSSGTWSLMGVEVTRPVINEKSLAYNVTNEGGVQGTFRLLKNIAGLWLVQECRRVWERQGKTYSYDQLTELASHATHFKALLNPDDPRFLNPTDMPEVIRAYCRETGQAIPETPGEVVRCSLESLALKYKFTLRQIEDLIGTDVERLHIVGGVRRTDF